MGVLLLEQIAGYFIMISTGFAIVKAGILKEEDSRVLSIIAIYLVLPCVIINAFQIDCTPETVKGLFMAFAAAIIIHASLFAFIGIAGRILELNEIEKASIMYSNAGNMIIPIIAVIMGEKWVLYSSAYISVQLVLLWTHCKSMICREKGFSIRKIVFNINMIAIALGICMFGLSLRLPGLIKNTMSTVGNMLAPISMVIQGMLLTTLNFRDILKNRRIYMVTILRMAAAPILILLLLWLSHMAEMVPNGERILFISFLSVITPVSATITQMAQVYGKDARYASALNGMTTLVSIITIPAMVAVYEILFGITL